MINWQAVLSLGILLFLVPTPSLGVEAQVVVTADNYYDLYLNGVFIGSENNGNGSYGWDAPEVWTVDLLVGENVVAVRGDDACCGSGMGVILQITSQNVVHTKTDGTWLVSATGSEGWTELGFDDSSWQAPLNQGPYNSQPWTLFAPAITEFAVSGARWLWRGNPPFQSGYGYYNNGAHTTCFFRSTFTVEPPIPVEGQSWSQIKARFR